ncbi:MAG: hypothetical protein RLZZ522_710 [Verrucomicrobiota bacterium]
MNDTVNALAVAGNNLYVGGVFKTAGGKPSSFIAKAMIGVAAVSEGKLGSLAYSPTTGFSCIFSDATIGITYRIQFSPAMAPGTWTDLTSISYAAPIAVTDPSAAGVTKRFYRAITP